MKVRNCSLSNALLKELSDEELVELARTENGNEPVTELMKRLSGFIDYKAMQFSNHYSYDRQDLHQQGLTAIVYAIRRFDAEKGVKFSTYAFRCAINAMCTLCGKANKKGVPTVTLESLYSAKDAADPNNELNAYEAVEEMAEKIRNRLSEFEKTVLALYLRGLSYAEIAAKTGKTVKSVDNAMQRIRRKLKED